MTVTRINNVMDGIVKQLRTEMEDAGIDPRTKESQEWFEEKIGDMVQVIDRRQLQREVLSLQGRIPPQLGRMYLFFYSPKTAATLPYYDRFPVIFLMKIEREYFQGLNLHYLPLDIRQDFFTRIQERKNKSVYDKQTYLRLDYDYLKSFRKYRAFKPCFKQYSLSNVRGRIVNVPSSEWEIVMNLPTAIWRKASESLVHSRSRRTYRSG
jgi:hypothetical protein